jgi:hypothetical protein
MSHDRNRALGRLAVEAGLIDETRLGEALSACADTPALPLEDYLCRRGWISPAQSARLSGDLVALLRATAVEGVLADARAALILLADPELAVPPL